MNDSTYHVIELIGSSSESWELAAQNAVRQAAKAYRDLRVAEVVEMDVLIENGGGDRLPHEAAPELQVRHRALTERGEGTGVPSSAVLGPVERTGLTMRRCGWAGHGVSWAGRSAGRLSWTSSNCSPSEWLADERARGRAARRSVGGHEDVAADGGGRPGDTQRRQW